jgi:hypothetical protein
MSRRAFVLLVAVGVTTAAAVALGVARLGESGETRDLALSSASYRWPVETLRDWADFADQLSVLRIESEIQLPRSPEEVASGEGPVARKVTVRIEETLWSNTGSPTAKGTISFVTWGWIAKGEKLIPATDSSSERLEVGDRVLAPLMFVDGSWGPLAPSTTMKLVNGRTAFVDRQRRSLTTLATRLDGVTPRQVADALAAVESRPDAAALRRLHPDERARRLAARS